VGEGLGNQFLANIREADAIAQVVRGFVDPDVVHVEGGVNPASDRAYLDEAPRKRGKGRPEFSERPNALRAIRAGAGDTFCVAVAAVLAVSVEDARPVLEAIAKRGASIFIASDGLTVGPSGGGGGSRSNTGNGFGGPYGGGGGGSRNTGGIGGDGICQGRDRVRAIAMGLLPAMDAPMRLLHEGVEMQPLLARHLGCFKKQVHEHGFAAPDLAHQIKPLRGVSARRGGGAAKKPAKQPGGLGGGVQGGGVITAQRLPQGLQTLHRRGLGRVGRQFATREPGLIGRQWPRRRPFGFRVAFLNKLHAARLP
jgi:hypothetical protein